MTRQERVELAKSRLEENDEAAEFFEDLANSYPETSISWGEFSATLDFGGFEVRVEI